MIRFLLPFAGGRERGAPPGAEAVSRQHCISAEHPVGLFTARTRRGALQATFVCSRSVTADVDL